MAIIKHHRLGGFKNRNLSYHSSGGWRSEIKGPAWSSLGGSPFSDLQIVPSSCFLTWQRGKERASSGLTCFLGQWSLMGALPLWPHLNPLSSQRPFLQNALTSWVGLQHTNFRRTQTFSLYQALIYQLFFILIFLLKFFFQFLKDKSSSLYSPPSCSKWSFPISFHLFPYLLVVSVRIGHFFPLLSLLCAVLYWVVTSLSVFRLLSSVKLNHSNKKTLPVAS